MFPVQRTFSVFTIVQKGLAYYVEIYHCLYEPKKIRAFRPGFFRVQTTK
jgi:hypothetical protein